jgi:hypothetical protein
MGRKKDKQILALPPFVPMTWQLLNSNAYKALSYASRALLPYFVGAPKYPDGKKINLRSEMYLRTEFTFSYKEAERYGCSTRTFTRVIEDLMRKGFIDPVDKGGLRGTGLSFNRFRMSERWKQYGAENFAEVRWKAFMPNIKNGRCIVAKSKAGKGNL